MAVDNYTIDVLCCFVDFSSVEHFSSDIFSPDISLARTIPLDPFYMV